MPRFAYASSGKYSEQCHLADLRSATDFLAVGRLAEWTFYYIIRFEEDFPVILLLECHRTTVFTLAKSNHSGIIFHFFN